ncbi:MAG: SHOCT domain-containing protein [Actinomycetota bacterium]|nr:SHOCT domain-containing protein [Actinomycetota bacterium]
MTAPLTLAVLAMFHGGHMNGAWGVLAVVAMAAMMGGMGWMMWSMMRGAGSQEEHSAEDPIELLKARYARGEITGEEFEERQRTLKDTSR